MADKEMDLYEIARELEDASRWRQDEVGEWWSALAALRSSVIDGGSEEFLTAYKKELRRVYREFKEEFRIVEKEITRTTTVRDLRHWSEVQDAPWGDDNGD